MPDHIDDVLDGKYPESFDARGSKRNEGSENGGRNIHHPAPGFSRSTPVEKKDKKDSQMSGRTSRKSRPMKVLPFSPEQLSLHETGLFSDEKEASEKVTPLKTLELD